MNAVEAELCVAGTCLSYPSAAEQIIAYISADMFTRPDASAIIRVTSKIVTAGNRPSFDAIRTGLIQDGFYEKHGGDETIVSLASHADVTSYEAAMLLVSNAWEEKEWKSVFSRIIEQAAKQGHWYGLKDSLFESVSQIQSKSSWKRYAIEEINSRIVRADSLYENKEPTIKVGDDRIATDGSLIQVVGQQKAGKSTLLYAMAFASMPESPLEASFGVWIQKNVFNQLILFVDTENSKQEQQEVIQTSMFRAGVHELSKHPDHIVCLNMKGVSKDELMRNVEVALEEGSKKHGGVHMIFLDSSTDLGNKMEFDSSDNAVRWMMEMASKHDATTVAANHFNPSDFKSSGHLGTRLNQRASGTINVIKDKDTKISKIYFSDLRRAENIHPLYFKWDSKRQYAMPVHKTEGDAAFASKTSEWGTF